jgi:putative transposase
MHLVFVTRQRGRVFAGAHLPMLREFLRDVCDDFACTLEDFDAGAGHAALTVAFPPKVAPSRLVNSLKGVSSRLMRREYPELAARCQNGTRLWSGSYYAGTAGQETLREAARRFLAQQDPGT